jgi:hypothetical protein
MRRWVGARNVRATTAQALRVSLFEVDPYSGASISSTIASMSSWGKAAMVVRTWEVARVETAAIYFRVQKSWRWRYIRVNCFLSCVINNSRGSNHCMKHHMYIVKNDRLFKG